MATWLSNSKESDEAGHGAKTLFKQRSSSFRRQRIRIVLRSCPLWLLVAGLLSWYVATSTGLVFLGVLFFVLTVAVVVDWAMRIPRSIVALRDGAEGEQATDRMLRRLDGQGWTVLHDQVGFDWSVQVEHIVVGPAGIYVVHSAKWETGPDPKVLGNMLWRGREAQTALLTEVRHQAKEVGRLLAGELGEERLPVTGVLAVHCKKGLPGAPRGMGGILVVEARLLVGELQRRATIWPPARVARVASAVHQVLQADSRDVWTDDKSVW